MHSMKELSQLHALQKLNACRVNHHALDSVVLLHIGAFPATTDLENSDCITMISILKSYSLQISCFYTLSNYKIIYKTTVQ